MESKQPLMIPYNVIIKGWRDVNISVINSGFRVFFIFQNYYHKQSIKTMVFYSLWHMFMDNTGLM